MKYQHFLGKDDTSKVHLVLRLVPDKEVFSCCVDWSDLFSDRPSYDVVIHAITLLNCSDRIISLESIVLDGFFQGHLIQRTEFDQPEIRLRATPIVERNQLGLRALTDLILWTDQVAPLEYEPSSETEINPGHFLTFPNTYLMFHKKTDKLKIIVRFDDEGEKKEIETQLEVVEHKSLVKYSFPLNGLWLMKGIQTTGCLNHHRFGVSSEFGVDFLRLGPGGEIFRNEGKLSSDFFGYGEMIFASASGKVVSVFDSDIQESSRFRPENGETQEQFQERQFRGIKKGLLGDKAKWAAGNYIIIEHTDHEYSAYLHLKEYSANVKKGDLINKGQYIANVGNTGDSFGAHLHFQVIDRPDLIRGRSLPFEFENLEISLSEPGLIVKSTDKIMD